MIAKLHHVEIGARKPDELITKLTKKFGFSPYAQRVAAGLRQVVLRTGNEIFLVVTELCDDKLKAFESFSAPAFTPGFGIDDLSTRVDSVYNVAFEVEDISTLSKSLVENREIAPIIQSGVVKDDNGSVRYVTIKSCVGDVCHTLIDKSDYTGSFLPTYSVSDLPPSNFPSSKLADIFVHIDHVAFGLPEGASEDVLNWYNRVLNFKRMMTSTEESRKDGLVVLAGNTGLCLRAMLAPKCNPSFCMVLAEPAFIKGAESASKNNQKLFLEHHSGPGVHHVALSTFDIVRTISRLEENEVVFVPNPPDAYYEDIEKVFVTTENKLFVPELKEHGILVDVEKIGPANVFEWLKLPFTTTDKFILQKFCRPLVDNTGETAFFEIIERRGGARAFGAGNVAALWKALVRQLEKEQLKKAKAMDTKNTIATVPP